MVLLAQGTSTGGTGSQVLTALFALNTPAGQVGTKPTVQGNWTNAGFGSMVIEEVSGLVTASTQAAFTDGTPAVKVNASGTNPATSGTYSSTASNEFLIFVYGDDGGPATLGALSTGYTTDTNNVSANSHADLGIGYKNSGNTSESASWALTGSLAGQVTILTAINLPASVGPSLTTPNLALAAPVPSLTASSTVALTTPNLALAAPLITPGVVPPTPTAVWSASYARNPVAYVAGPPALSPLAIPVSNTAGQWLFAVATWRQDAGIAGDLQYPSTVSVADDAGNFWIPVESGVPAQAPAATPSTGILRTAIWMAPAARQAEFVFVSPTGYQSSLTAQIFQFPGVVPWYQVQIQAEVFTNRGTSVSVTVSPGTNVFALGAVAWDNLSASVSVTAAGWTALATKTASNGSNHTGDLEQAPYNAIGSAGTLTLSASSATTMDWAAVIISVHGVADAIAFPYSLANRAGNWPVLITEIGSGPNVNKDAVFAQGAAFWTGQGAAVAGVSWPQWAPLDAYQAVLYGSLQVTPGGGSGAPGAVSDIEAVSVTTLYTALAVVYCPSGYGNGTSSGAVVGIQWLNGIGGSVGVSNGPVTQLTPGEWTVLSLPPSFPALGTVNAQVVVNLQAASGNVSPSAAFYIAYASFSPADAYEGAPPDQIAWTDISARNITLGDLEWSRGIQYENQSLEAGTSTVNLNNFDAALTFGNVASPFWPNMGDTDVPFRLRAIWPGSLTPYFPLFSGFTDDIKFAYDTQEDTWIAYAAAEGSDAWSRLTQQMLAVVENEALLDNPVAFIPCSQTGANIVAGGAFNSTPAVPVHFNQSYNQLSITPPAQSFSGGGISLAGAPGLSCWEVTGTATAQISGLNGWCLAWQPAGATLNVAAGVTVEFWYSPVTASASMPQGVTLPVIYAVSSTNAVLWELFIDNQGSYGGAGGAPGGPDASLSFMYLFTSNFAPAPAVGSVIPFLETGFNTQSYFISVTFNQSQVTATINPGGTLTETLTVTGLSMASQCTGFFWCGHPLRHGADGAVADIGIYNTIIPAARSAAHYQAGATAFASETDTLRLARVASYSGFVPVLGMRGLDLPAAGTADVDVVTGATDTNTQVVSAYFTNIASSTLAAMFVNGAGTLMYRRRMEWYNRPIGQWVLGENDSQSLSLGLNPLSAAPSVTGWTTGNGAALTSGTAPAGGALFVPSAGLFAGNGSTANPFIVTTTNPAVTPGQFYQFTTWLYSAQGWTGGGVTAQIQFFNASNVQVGPTQSSPVATIAAGSVAYASVGPVQAPATAAYLKAVIQANGTPPGSTGFYVAAATASQVGFDYAPGAGVAVPETPYLADVTISSDRAQLYNYAVVTQYGTNLVSSFSGTSVLFTPSSGVIVIISNVPSIALRGQVPYTATSYINNTVQGFPYELNEGSIEDEANWITQTLGAPLFRPDQVSLTPAATPSALVTALTAEVGDTVVFRRRQPGVPEIQILTYISKLTHTVNIDAGEWTTEVELSPFPQGEILTADDVVHGVLTGQPNLGW